MRRGQIGFFFVHTIADAVPAICAQCFTQTVDGEKAVDIFSCRKIVPLCGFYFFFDDFISVHIGKDIGKVFCFLLTGAECLWVFLPSFFFVSNESVLFAIRIDFSFVMSLS